MSTNSENGQLRQRIEELESKVAFQDDTIEQLNQSIIDLSTELQAVKNDLLILADKLADSNQNSNDPSEVEIPPHY